MTPKIPSGTNVPFSEIVKNPQIWGYFMIVSLLVWGFSYLMYRNNDVVSKSDEICQKEKEQWRQMYLSENKKVEVLYKSLSLKNGVISNLTTITDSLNKTNESTK
jgi:hypothetical protein